MRFAFEGTGHEIDLNAKNAAAFGKQLAPYLEHGLAVSERGRIPAGVLEQYHAAVNGS